MIVYLGLQKLTEGIERNCRSHQSQNWSTPYLIFSAGGNLGIVLVNRDPPNAQLEKQKMSEILSWSDSTSSVRNGWHFWSITFHKQWYYRPYFWNVTPVSLSIDTTCEISAFGISRIFNILCKETGNAFLFMKHLPKEWSSVIKNRDPVVLYTYIFALILWTLF